MSNNFVGQQLAGSGLDNLIIFAYTLRLRNQRQKRGQTHRTDLQHELGQTPTMLVASADKLKRC
jgi:hypothetical protein